MLEGILPPLYWEEDEVSAYYLFPCAFCAVMFSTEIKFIVPNTHNTSPFTTFRYACLTRRAISECRTSDWAHASMWLTAQMDDAARWNKADVPLPLNWYRFLGTLPLFWLFDCDCDLCFETFLVHMLPTHFSSDSQSMAAYTPPPSFRSCS